MKFHTNDIYVCLEIDIRRDSPENYLQKSRTYSRYASCIVIGLLHQNVHYGFRSVD